MQNCDFSYAPSLWSRLIQSDFTLCFFVFLQGILPPKKGELIRFVLYLNWNIFWYHLEEDAFFKGHVKYYWINYGQSRPLQSHIITLEGNCTATAATATIANTNLDLYHQPLPRKGSLSLVLPIIKNKKNGWSDSPINHPYFHGQASLPGRCCSQDGAVAEDVGQVALPHVGRSRGEKSGI